MSKGLRVNVNGKWYYPSNDFVMIQMSEQDQKNINNMHEDCDSYIIYPDYLDSDKVDEKVAELKEVGFCPACTVDNPVERILRESFLERLFTTEAQEQHEKYEEAKEDSNKSWQKLANKAYGDDRIFGYTDLEKSAVTNAYNVLKKARGSDVENACMEMEANFDFLEPDTLEKDR